MLGEVLDVGALLGRKTPSVLDDVVFIEGRSSGRFVDVLDGLPGISLVAPDGNGVVAAGDFDKVVAMMRHCHELGQCGVSQYNVVRQGDVSDIEDHRLRPEIVPRAKSNRKTYLANRSGRSVGDSVEGLGRLKARVRHLHLIEGGDRDDVESGSTVHEGLGDLYVVDGGRVDERKGSRGCCALRVVFTGEGNLMLRPLQLRGIGVALSSRGGADEMFEMSVGEGRLGAAEDAE